MLIFIIHFYNFASNITGIVTIRTTVLE